MSDLIPAARLVAEIGVDGEVAAGSKLAAFGAQVAETTDRQVSGAARSATAVEASTTRQTASYTRLGTVLRATAAQAGSFDVPFTGAFGRVATVLDNTAGHATSFGSRLADIGRTEAVVAAVGLVAVGTEAVHLADSLELAHAREVTAVANTGKAYDIYAGQVKGADDAGAKLGFTNADTESSLASLTTATHNAATAVSLEAEAENVARFEHSSLAQATQLLVSIEGGRLRGLQQLGISTKDATGHTISSAEAIQLVANVTKNEANAAADTFAGKMRTLSVEGQNLGAALGTAVVPKIEEAASASLTAVHGIEFLNSASHGLVGEVALLTAGVPLAAFALAKLAAGALAVGEALPIAEGASLGLVYGLEAITAAAVPVAVGVGAVYASFKILEAFQPNFGEKIDKEAKTAGAALQQTGHLVGDQVRQVNADFGVSAHAIDVYRDSLLRGASQQDAFAAAVKANVANGPAYTGELHLWTADVDKYVASLDPAARAQALLSAAQQQYANDLQGGHASQVQLTTDAMDVTNAEAALAGMQGAVNDATAAGAAKASDEANAFAGLAQTATQAASAMSAMNSEIFAGLTQTTDSHKVTADLAGALTALHTAGTAGSGGGGGGGSHVTAAQAALTQQQNELSLRDALVAVSQESGNVTSADHQLAAARAQDVAATVAVSAAELNYEQVLHGVAATSQQALTAQEDLQKAQLAAQSSMLDVKDAEASLATTRKTAADDQAANAKTVADAQSRLSADTAAGADPSRIVADQKAVADAKRAAATQAATDTEAVQRATIALAEAKLREKDATDAANASQKNYSGTLHGFPATSDQAKAAADQLTSAQRAAVSADDSVTSALNGVVSAQNAVATNALALLRAQETLDGVLTASAGSGGGAAKAAAALQTFQTKLDAAAAAAKAEAIDVGTTITNSTHAVGLGMLAEVEALQMIVDQNPILKAALGPAIATAEAKLRQFASAAFVASVPIPGGNVVQAGIGGSITLPGTAPGHAAGGTIEPGTFGTTGEQGTELLYAKPGGGVDVLSNAQSRHVLANGGTAELLAKLDQIAQLLAGRPPLHIENLNTGAEPDSAVNEFRRAQNRAWFLSPTLVR